MAIKRHKPTSPGRRFRTDLVTDEITKTKPEKSLSKILPKKAVKRSSLIRPRKLFN